MIEMDRAQMEFSSARLYSVDEVCHHCKFTVPNFQRGYAWQEEHWQALWDDIANMTERPHAQHYAGSIMVAPAANSAESVELIDGQQRLTSMSLLLHALGHTAFAIDFSDNVPLQTYYDYYALGRTHLFARLEQNRSYYCANLALAAGFFARQSQQLSPESRTAFAKTLLNRFKLFVLVIESDFDVHVAFEAINNRGKPLSTLEKLKNRLIYLASQDSDAIAARSAINDIHRCWQGVYAWLGAGKTLLDDDQFLRAHSFGWFRHERKSGWLIKQLFDEEFSIKGSTGLEEISSYVRSLEVAAACWHHLHEPVRLPSQVARGLVAFQRTTSTTSRPLLLWALVRISEKNKSLTSHANSDVDWHEPFQRLVAQAERFAALVVLANDRLSSVGQSDINRSAFALAHPGERLYADHLSLTYPEGVLEAIEFAGGHLQSLIWNVDYDTDEYVDSRFRWSGYFEWEKVQEVIADRFRRGTGFYNWQFGKLVIYLWEEFLRGERGRPEKRAWDRFSWDDSVEHVYPQNPHARWSDEFTIDGRLPRARSTITNSLGNLLLLSTSVNSSISNHPYVENGQIPGKRQRFYGGSYSEMQVARLCKTWTVVQIAARGIAMFRCAQRHWRFEVVDNDAKLTDWLPLLFGDVAEKVRDGMFTGGKKVDGRALQPWVEKFEDLSLIQ